MKFTNRRYSFSLYREFERSAQSGRRIDRYVTWQGQEWAANSAWGTTKSLPGYDLAVTTQKSVHRRVRTRPEGPPNLYQLRGRWEWVTLLVELLG